MLGIAAKDSAGVTQGDQNDVWFSTPRSLVLSLDLHDLGMLFNREQSGFVVSSWAVCWAKLRTVVFAQVQCSGCAYSEEQFGLKGADPGRQTVLKSWHPHCAFHLWNKTEVLSHTSSSQALEAPGLVVVEIHRVESWTELLGKFDLKVPEFPVLHNGSVIWTSTCQVGIIRKFA